MESAEIQQSEKTKKWRIVFTDREGKETILGDCENLETLLSEAELQRGFIIGF